MKKKHVLLLGDSSRMLYEDYVREKLPEVVVDTPDENCRFSAYMLNSLRFWLPNFEKPDVIHINCGLWDTACLYVDDGPFTPIEDFVRNMCSVVRELQRFGVPIIYATSTPVKAELIKAVATPSVDAPDAATVFKQDNARIAQYNAAVTEALQKRGVIINDLHGLIAPRMEELISPDGIHLNSEGVAICGDAVVEHVKKFL